LSTSYKRPIHFYEVFSQFPYISIDFLFVNVSVQLLPVVSKYNIVFYIEVYCVSKKCNKCEWYNSWIVIKYVCDDIL